MSKENAGHFSIEIPLDASGVEGFTPEKAIKVLVKDKKGVLYSQEIQLDKEGKGQADFRFSGQPGPLQIVVGPGDATDQELLGLQTINIGVSTRQWQGKNQLQLTPILISAYYWWWWWRWCRTFTIHGRVVCADGSPVPGAKVCAYDVDWWWLWSSTQQVGCATTDINGAFEIKFRWCCGWWPWWWWRYRTWQLNPLLTARVQTVLQQAPDLQLSPITSNQPGLSVFKELLSAQGLSTHQPLAATDAGKLEMIRSQLTRKLPASTELAQLRIWPWWPWQPWWDCNPDIIFKVTQDCHQPGTVIVEENIFDARWNISNPLNVTLIANENACCRRLPCHDEPCDDGECLLITQVCGDPINRIGGNTGAPATPAGYLYAGEVLPGTISSNGDRPYAGGVSVYKNSGDMLNVDYYEIEFFSGGTWNPLPPGAAIGFTRKWMVSPTFVTGDESFPFVTKPDGSAVPHSVVESREHFEATHYFDWWPPGTIASSRFWIMHEFKLFDLDSSKFADGTYQFRVVGWQLGASGELINRRVLPVCNTASDNNLVLTFDNRVVSSLAHSAAGHGCGGVHTCTLEPDTHIMEVRINGVKVQACDTINAKEGWLEIDFLAQDADGHLGEYTLQATYGLNQVVNLLSQPSTTLTPMVAGTQTGWNSGNTRGTYGVALAQGATAPQWYGGKYTLRVDVAEVFQVPCCYQFELRAYKRSVVSCDHGFAYQNLTEYSIGVGICP